MTTQIDNGLRVVFVVQAVSSFLTGALGVFLPAAIIGLSGLDLAATPAIQQAGALSLGYTLGAVMALRATNWEQVKIFVYASLVAFVLSLVGAGYYIFIVGVVAIGLIVILVASILVTIGFGYAIYHHRGA
jgi:hypothetical protein